jgi:hypothetical protein
VNVGRSDFGLMCRAGLSVLQIPLPASAPYQQTFCGFIGFYSQAKTVQILRKKALEKINLQKFRISKI